MFITTLYLDYDTTAARNSQNMREITSPSVFPCKPTDTAGSLRRKMASTERKEKVPLFADESDIRNQVGRNKSFFLQNKYATGHGVLLIVNLLLLALNMTLFISNTASLRSHDSPAELALEYITVEERSYEESPSPYTGEPRAELDQAWSQILRSTLLRMTKKEMIKMNRTSLALLDGSGYVGYLESFHMLHCLSHHPEQYPEQQRDGAFTTSHLCVMCNADVTVNTLFWESPGFKVRSTKMHRLGPPRDMGQRQNAYGKGPGDIPCYFGVAV
ncbi:hypothetical protein GGR58DRAFT_520254 [Xylaria digitata]|nr:hypothetical protein GGR58DRAFT_520254 [Xylaria digitata]